MGQSKSKNAYTLTEEVQIARSIFNGGILDVKVDNNEVISCSDDKSIASFNWNESILKYASVEKKYYRGHTRAVNRICVRGDIIFSASRDLSVRLWRKSNFEAIHCLENCHTLNVAAITASKKGSLFASGSRDYTVKVRDVETTNIIREYSTPRNVVTCLQFDEDGKLLYQGSEDLSVHIYDTRAPSSSTPVKQLSGYVYFPISLDVHSSGNYIITGCKGFNTTGGGKVKLWDLRSSKVVSELKQHTHDVTGCKFIGNSCIAVCKDGTLSYWDIFNTIVGNSRIFSIPGSNLLTAVDVLESTNQEIKIVTSSFDGSLYYVNLSNTAELEKISMRVLSSTPCHLKSIDATITES